MAKLKNNDIAIAFDMGGCPNRCKHCWIGYPNNKKMDIEKIKDIVDEFRKYKLKNINSPYFEKIIVNTWFREPDYLPNYQELYNLEKELGDEVVRFELMSIWRIVRDEEYAKWAKSIGTDKCQITFFGLEDNTDYFTGRRGAFKDNLIATEKLIKGGIAPRWQLFLNEKNKHELNHFVKIIENLDLENKVKNIGKEFEIYVYIPAPDGEAFNLEDIRPKEDIFSLIPEYLKNKTLKYLKAKDLKEVLGYKEKELLPTLLNEDSCLNDYPPILSMMITSELDVYCNAGELKPWWCLGNLNNDSVETIIDNYLNNKPLGLKLMYEIPVSNLAKEFGDTNGEKIYAKEDLIRKYIRMYGEKYGHSKIE